MRASAPLSVLVLLGLLGIGVVHVGPGVAQVDPGLRHAGVSLYLPEVEAAEVRAAAAEVRAAAEIRAEPRLRQAVPQQSIDDLRAIFRRIDGLQQVEVTVDDRILELSGTALSHEDRTRAGELAQGVPGVVWVDNRIVVETDLRRRLAPVMERLAEKGDRALRFLPSFLVGLFLIGGSFVLAYFAGRWLFPVGKGDPGPFHRNLMRQVLRGAIGLTGILLALELMDATALVGAVLGAAGVMGIAVGFAFRDIVENYLSGVLLSLRQPFAPNDHVELGGHEGRIVRLTGRETVLMTLDGNHVRVPNATVFKSVMTNFSRNPRRRFAITVGIAPDEAIRPALEAGRSALETVPGILSSPAVSARVHGFGDSTVDLRFGGWVDQTEADFQKVRSEAFRATKERFEKEGIQTPPPEYGVRILGREEGRPAEPPTKEPDAPPDTEPPDAPPADVSPDTTIEEEIAREKRESDEEDLLKR